MHFSIFFKNFVQKCFFNFNVERNSKNIFCFLFSFVINCVLCAISNAMFFISLKFIRIYFYHFCVSNANKLPSKKRNESHLPMQ